MRCSQAQADTWLNEDLIFSEYSVNALVTVALTQDEFDSLVDFVFNLGRGNFAHSTLLRLLNSGNYTGAANEFDKWDYVAGKQCAGLLRRREAERQEFNGAD
jgi:lysozyme